MTQQNPVPDPTARLQAAADHLRTLATNAAATAGDTWYTRLHHPDNLTSNWVTLWSQSGRAVIHGHDSSGRGRGPFVIDTVGDYMAAMSPARGLVLADTLQWMAVAAARAGLAVPEAALALADAILTGTGQ
jgi:hypothetical protein